MKITPKGVHALLKEKHHIAALGINGDYGASDILLDLNNAIAKAQLTSRQQETIRLLFDKNLNQQEAAQVMGITQHTVSAILKGALIKIANVYATWDE